MLRDPVDFLWGKSLLLGLLGRPDRCALYRFLWDWTSLIWLRDKKENWIELVHARLWCSQWTVKRLARDAWILSLEIRVPSHISADSWALVLCLHPMHSLGPLRISYDIAVILGALNSVTRVAVLRKKKRELTVLDRENVCMESWIVWKWFQTTSFPPTALSHCL